jgi:ankyrin repeat protein
LENDTGVSKLKEKIEDKKGYTPLHRKIIAKDQFDINDFEEYFSVPDILGWTPLHYAVLYSPPIASALVEKTRVLANKVDLADRTPLHYAVMKLQRHRQEGIGKAIEDLLEHTNPSQGKDGQFPLHWAVKTGNIAATKLLLTTRRHRNTINTKDCWHMTPLHFAALGGHLEIMEDLLGTEDTTPALDARDLFSRTVLHVAVIGIRSSDYHDGAKIIKRLLSKGADVRLKDRDEKKALDLAAEAEVELKLNYERDRAVEKSLIAAGDAGPTEGIADKSEMTDQQSGMNTETEIRGSAEEKIYGSIVNQKAEQLRSSIRSLLERENLLVDGGSLLLWAVKRNFETPFDVLIHSDLITKDDMKVDLVTRRSILHIAADAESNTMVERILERWNPNNAVSGNNKSNLQSQETLPLDLRDALGETALMLASKKCYDTIVVRLLKADAKKDITDEFGRTALSLAVDKGHVSIVTKLLVDGASPDIEDIYGYTALMLAVKQGSEKIVKRLLDAKADKDITDRNGRTALSWAAELGHLDIVTELINQGASLKTKNKVGKTPTFFAATNGKLEILKLFVKKGADPNEVNATDDSILCCAIEAGHKEIVKLLLDEGAEIEKHSGRYNQTPLSWAARKGNFEITNLLLDRKASVQAEDIEGWTPLIWALKTRRSKVAQLLLDHGADKDLKGNKKEEQLESAIIWACNEGDVEFVKLLLSFGTNINAVAAKTKSTPLIEASREGKAQVVQLLLEKGASVDAQDRYKSTALHEAIRKGHEELQNVVTMLLKAKANIDLPNISGETPLFLAVRNNNEDIARLLVQGNADVNLADNQNQTPLLIAAREGYNNMVEILLKPNTNVDFANKQNETPLLLAISNEDENITKLLLGANADFNQADDEGMTPLALAVSFANEKLVEMLLNKGASPNTKSRDNKTLLLRAVENGIPKIVKLLSEAPADINLEDENGKTPLFNAVCAENSEIVLILLEHDANPEKHPIYRMTPLQEAARWNAIEIVDIMLSHGADINGSDEQGRNAFHISAEYGRSSILESLVQKGRTEGSQFDLFGESLRDKQGRDVFHHAPASESIDMITYLLQLSPHKNNFRRGDNDDWTPLHWAAQAGDVNVVEELIAAGASLDAKKQESIKKWTPRQIASYNGYDEIVNLLERFALTDEKLPAVGTSHWGATCDGCYCFVSKFERLICRVTN